MKGMMISAVVVACSMAVGGAALAQEKKEGAAKEHTMTGCVQKGTSADTFVLTNAEAKGPKTISIVESKENLAPHVGHTIAITGTDVPAKEAEGMKTKPSKGDHYMRVSSIKMVSASCK